jgi:Raf kinase inhibitor-like YbhB/YbcL family protein
MKIIVYAVALMLGGSPCGAAAPFVLSSPDVPAGGSIPLVDVFNQAGCTGGNLSPALHWAGVPVGTRSFALTVFDPDEKVTGSGWWHWVVYNLPASSRGLPRGAGKSQSRSLPQGAIQGRSDLGTAEYHGPCPELRQSHRYVFTLYALSVDTLPVDAAATPAMVRFVLNGFIVGTATLAATFARTE